MAKTDRLSNVAKLEDYGVRNATTPEQRLKVYQEQSKGLRKNLQARFWLGVLGHDPQVAELVKAKDGTKNAKRKR